MHQTPHSTQHTDFLITLVTQKLLHTFAPAPNFRTTVDPQAPPGRNFLLSPQELAKMIEVPTTLFSFLEARVKGRQQKQSGL